MTPPSTFEIVTQPDRLAALEAEWDALWQRADRPHFSQSFAWCVTGWRTTASVRGRRLHVVVMREAGRTVLIWPMTTRRHQAWTIAAALGAESTEYDPILVEQGAAAIRRVRAAMAFVRQHSGADVITVPFVRAGSAAYAVLTESGAAGATHTLPAPYTCFTAVGSWDAYWRSRSSNLRGGLSRRRRRLNEYGQVTLDWVTDTTEFAAVLDWTLRQKRDWMARNDLRNDFIATEEYRSFLLALAERPARLGRMAMLVLRVNGQPVAVKIGSIDGTRYEGFITTYDPAYSACSPGQIILMDCLQWCHAHGLQYDFRIGEEAYKDHWANADCPATTFVLANNAWGALRIAFDTACQRGRETKDRLRERIPATWRRWVKVTARQGLAAIRTIRPVCPLSGGTRGQAVHGGPSRAMTVKRWRWASDQGRSYDTSDFRREVGQHV